MKTKRSPLVGKESSSVALLLIDVVNLFDFDGAEPLLASARAAARVIARLREDAYDADVPVVYVNDNFGRWRSDFRAIVRACRAPEAKAGAREIVERLAPSRRDYFVLKPTNSGFYGSALATLLRDLGVKTLVLAGFATDNCILFTAHDAYLRGFQLVVPCDCVAAESAARQRNALRTMEQTTKADTRPWKKGRFAQLSRRGA